MKILLDHTVEWERTLFDAKKSFSKPAHQSNPKFRFLFLFLLRNTDGRLRTFSCGFGFWTFDRKFGFLTKFSATSQELDVQSNVEMLDQDFKCVLES